MRVLLAVDLQREFKDNDGMYEDIVAFVNNNKHLYDKVIALKCINTPDSGFVKYNAWTDCLDGCEALDFVPDEIMLKSSYGLTSYDELPKTDKYDIIGYNTDACVLKVAMDMFDRTYDIRVLTGFCYSSNGLERHKNGVDLLKRLLGNAVF